MSAAAARPNRHGGRLAAVVALLVAIAAVVYVLTSGGSHQYTLLFQNAGQLVVGNTVQIGGVVHGTIDSIDLTDHNQARVTISVDEPFAPIHEGTTAEIRGASLSGVANRFIALHLGPNSTPELSDGATLGTNETAGIVDIDQIFDMLDKPTRTALQNVVQGSAIQFKGEPAALQSAAHYFSPLLSTSGQLFGALIEDQQTFKDFLSSTSATMTALAQRAPQIEGLVDNGAAAFSATASQQNALRQGLNELPGTLNSGNEALASLSATIPALRKLVAATKPAVPGLAPFLKQTETFLNTSQPALSDLAVAFSPTEPSIVSATNQLPALEQELGPAATNSSKALKQLNPILAFTRPYAPELTSALRTFGQASATYDANGHYLRGSANFNSYVFSGGNPGTLTPNPPSQPFAGLQSGLTARCPGSAVQPTPDGSAPWSPPGGSCSPSQVPAG